jgi:hypothetical protein
VTDVSSPPRPHVTVSRGIQREGGRERRQQRKRERARASAGDRQTDRQTDRETEREREREREREKHREREREREKARERDRNRHTGHRHIRRRRHRHRHRHTHTGNTDRHLKPALSYLVRLRPIRPPGDLIREQLRHLLHISKSPCLSTFTNDAICTRNEWYKLHHRVLLRMFQDKFKDQDTFKDKLKGNDQDGGFLAKSIGRNAWYKLHHRDYF